MCKVSKANKCQGCVYIPRCHQSTLHIMPQRRVSYWIQGWIWESVFLSWPELFLRKDVGQRCWQRCALQESLDVGTCFPCWAKNSMCLGSVQAGCEGSCWAGSLDGAEALLPLTAEALRGLSASEMLHEGTVSMFPSFYNFFFFYGLLWYWKPRASIISLG